MNKYGEFFKPKVAREMKVRVQLCGFIMSDKGDHFKIYLRGNDLTVFKGKTDSTGHLIGVRFAYFWNKTPIHARIKYHKKINLHKTGKIKRLKGIDEQTFTMKEFYENVI